MERAREGQKSSKLSIFLGAVVPGRTNSVLFEASISDAKAPGSTLT